jgi:hypothetical protein
MENETVKTRSGYPTPVTINDEILLKEEALQKDRLCGFCGANLKTEDCPSDCPSWDNLYSVDCVGTELLSDVFDAIADEATKRVERFTKRTNCRPTLRETNEIFIVVAYEVGKQSK